MSGWIKFNKDLVNSIRFRRLTKAYARHALRDVTERDVTTLVGALVRLWMYADSHIREDNTLAITVDEINEVVAVEGFAQALPADWLQVIGPDNVELPDFIEHNGSSAKRREDAARRAAEYRAREKAKRSNADVTRDVTHGNARHTSRLDQTRKNKPPIKAPAAPFAPQSVPGLDLNAWTKWVAYRSARKPAIKPVSMLAAAQEMAALGADQAASVQQSIAKGWQGLFPVKQHNGAGAAIPRASSAWTEEVKREMQAELEKSRAT